MEWEHRELRRYPEQLREWEAGHVARGVQALQVKQGTLQHSVFRNPGDAADGQRECPALRMEFEFQPGMAGVDQRESGPTALFWRQAPEAADAREWR